MISAHPLLMASALPTAAPQSLIEVIYLHMYKPASVPASAPAEDGHVDCVTIQSLTSVLRGRRCMICIMPLFGQPEHYACV